MAALPDTDRHRTAMQLQRKTGWPSLVKADVRAAVNAVDDFLETNATALNSALPQPFRGAASPSQKALLYAYVCMRKAGELKAEEDAS